MKQKVINNKETFSAKDTKDKIYDTAVFGMGYFALGYANSHKNTVIIERAELCDTAFCGCMNVGSDWDYVPKGAFGTGLRESFMKYKLLCEGMADILSFESVLCEYIKANLPEILLLTDIISVNKQKDIYSINIYNNAGQSKILARKIIDTTPRGVFYSDSNYEKHLNLLCLTMDEKFPDAVKNAFGDDAYISPTPRPEYKVLSIACGKDESLLSSRIRIHDKWEQTLSVDGFKISKIASDFMLKTQSAFKYIDEFYEGFCECNAKNAFIAADTGESFEFKNSI